MAVKSQPFTLRLSASLDKLVSEEARRSRRSKAAVIEALADEALRCRRFPGIAFRGSDWNRRAWVVGTSLDVWEIIQAFQDFGSVERMAATTDLAERQIRLALAYYREFAQEIDQAITDNMRSLQDLRSSFPTFDVIEVEG